jgi:hypothetical protein
MGETAEQTAVALAQLQSSLDLPHYVAAGVETAQQQMRAQMEHQEAVTASSSAKHNVAARITQSLLAKLQILERGSPNRPSLRSTAHGTYFRGMGGGGFGGAGGSEFGGTGGGGLGGVGAAAWVAQAAVEQERQKATGVGAFICLRCSFPLAFSFLYKKENAIQIEQYRPIYFLNVSFKVFNKVGTNQFPQLLKMLFSRFKLLLCLVDIF